MWSQTWTLSRRCRLVPFWSDFFLLNRYYTCTKEYESFIEIEFTSESTGINFWQSLSKLLHGQISCDFMYNCKFAFQETVPMPRYSTGYYFSEPAKPTVSEERVFASYREHFNYPRTVREMIQRIQQSNEVPVGEEAFHLHHRKKLF